MESTEPQMSASDQPEYSSDSSVFQTAENRIVFRTANLHPPEFIQWVRGGVTPNHLAAACPDSGFLMCVLFIFYVSVTVQNQL